MGKLPTILTTVLVCTCFAKGFDESHTKWRVKEKIIGYGEDLRLRCNCGGDTNSTFKYKQWNGGPNFELLSSGYAIVNTPKYDIIIRKQYYILIIKNVGKSDINELYECNCGFNSYTKRLLISDVFKEPTPPKHFKAIALENKIIVKWTAENLLRFQLTFGVEYREYFEPYWKRMSAENKSTAIIDRLRHGTLYFVRVFSMTAMYESSRTEEIVVKTEKQHSMVHVISVKFAVIVGALPLTMFLCWCGTKGWTNRKSCCKNQDRVTQSRIHDDVSVRQDHYEEIGSMHYNPHILVTVEDQDTSTSPHMEILQAPINNGNNYESLESNNHISQNMMPCSSHQFESAQNNRSPRPSSDESYLIPCRNNIDFDLENFTINADQEIDTSETQVLDESSTTSHDSETDPKSIRKYETLQLSDAHEYSYERYKETDV